MNEATQFFYQIVEEILRSIQMENPKPGDRFHSEQQLCAMLGVSCSSIREALGSPETMGWRTICQR
ncbi:MAG: GntR family transcriptional regulator [Rectinemataceae bacterium]